MTEVVTRFKPERQPPRRRAWNSTLPAPTNFGAHGKSIKASGLSQRPAELKREPQRLRTRTAKAARDDRSFKAGARAVVCERCRRQPASDASHRGTRAQRPDLRGDAANRDDLCRVCHQWVEADAGRAKAEGWRLAETYEAANADPMAKVRRQLGAA